jgi:hypothetical protein
MATRGTRGTTLRLLAALASLALALPAAAQAADPAAATISSCKADNLTVAGKVRLSGSAARKARGATLEMRFQTLPLFGLPRSGSWRSSGKKTKASAHETFNGLGADNWVGVMSWRFKKGRKRVLSGNERSQPVKIGSSKGRASCTIGEGTKPVDVTPPTLTIVPADGAWHHATATVQLIAQDDFSGVKGVRYSLDGGAVTALPNGSTFTIATEGEHKVDWAATDVAGNTGTRNDIVRADAAPPSKPALSSPPSATASTTPTFTWSASTDSGSGLRGYLLTIRNSGGTVVGFQTIPAGTTSVASPATLTEGETYTAVVTAVDNTADPAWTTDSDTLTFKVDSTPEATSFSPASGTVLSGALKGGPFTINLDRAADPATVSATTVKLDRAGGTDPTYTAGCATAACTSITVDPTNPNQLAEGHYVLSLNGVKSAAEGLTFTGSANYAVPFTESGTLSADATPAACIVGDASETVSYSVSAADAGQTAFLDFDITYSGTGGWTMAVSGATSGASINGFGAGHYRLDFPSSASGMLTFTLTAHCSGGATTSVSASNLFGSRYP